ncbi:MAG: TIGR04053 family radical SAM/SPASM domain-containing protein [Bacteroidia bacterium]
MSIVSLKHNKYIYNERPFLIYWELTRSCDLACKHCRAEAQIHRNPFELNKEACFKVLQEIKDFGKPTPQVVITGGDPLKHPDWQAVLERAKELEIPMAMSPSGTNSLNREAFQIFKDNNVLAMSLSIDGATRESHDAFRGVPGCWDHTMRAIEYAREFDIPLQINSLVSGGTKAEIPAIYEMLTQSEIMRWSVFFLISVGRGNALQDITPDEAEDVMHWLYDKAKVAPFAIKTTEAPHYRRVMIQRMQKSVQKIPLSKLPVARGFGIRDGNGIMFISHTGDVYPSGFLPLKAGNVKTTSVSEIYQDSTLFREIRDPNYFEGKCGECEFRYVCGGSRSRAFAQSGNPYASDLLCPYEPKKKYNEAEVLVA